MKFLDEPYAEQDVKELCQSTRKGNYNKWKHTFSEKERELFEHVASNALKTEGYEVKYPVEKIHLGICTYYTFHNTMKHLKNLVKMNIWDSIAIKFFHKEPFNE